MYVIPKLLRNIKIFAEIHNCQTPNANSFSNSRFADKYWPEHVTPTDLNRSLNYGMFKEHSIK